MQNRGGIGFCYASGPPLFEGLIDTSLRLVAAYSTCIAFYWSAVACSVFLLAIGLAYFEASIEPIASSMVTFEERARSF